MANWEPLRDLAKRVLREGEPLVLTPKVRRIIRGVARDVAVPDAEIAPALRSASRAKALIRKVNHRIRSGSDRLSTARSQMYELRDRGCIEEARKVMRDLLAIEVVPFYRDLIQINLDHLAVWKPDIRTQPPEWNDIRELAARLKAGQPLRLTPKVITILKRAAPTLGFGDDETAKGLRTVESATTLLRRMHRRIQRGANQLFETTFQMYIRRDTGDLEGARQVMSDALAVEVVPQRRRLMAHYLEQLDRWKPPRSKRTAARKTPHGKASPPRKPRKDSKGTRRSRSG